MYFRPLREISEVTNPYTKLTTIRKHTHRCGGGETRSHCTAQRFLSEVGGKESIIIIVNERVCVCV